MRKEEPYILPPTKRRRSDRREGKSLTEDQETGAGGNPMRKQQKCSCELGTEQRAWRRQREKAENQKIRREGSWWSRLAEVDIETKRIRRSKTEGQMRAEREAEIKIKNKKKKKRKIDN